MSEQHSIRPGQIVQPKSGGQQMTVTSIDEHQGAAKALCVWFLEDEQHEQLFPIDSLEVVELIED